MSRRTDLLVALVLALAVFVLDQGLKAIVQGAMRPGESIPVIPGFLSITYIRNAGGAFGILGGSQVLLLVGSAVVRLQRRRRRHNRRGRHPAPLHLQDAGEVEAVRVSKGGS